MTSLVIQPQREQSGLPGEPYDRWVSPAGEVICEFHRDGDAFLLRLPDEVDFRIDACADAVRAFPASADKATIRKLFDNAIIPLLGNYREGLFLHGSAVLAPVGAIAFLGASRSGKTTLAGAFAKAGHPVMTEDVVELTMQCDAVILSPKPSALRVFEDSAAFLANASAIPGERGEKVDIEASDDLPFAVAPAPLKAIFLLGDDHAAPLQITRQSQAVALPALLPHGFVLDVEDKARMRRHFDRIGDLAERVPVFALDYPREYSAMPQVMAAISKAVEDL